MFKKVFSYICTNYKIFVPIGLILIISIALAIRIVYFPIINKNHKILDRKGELLYETIVPNKGYESYLTIESLNPMFLEAIVAVEDKSFWNNAGIDIPRTVKCIFSYFDKSTPICGASTITQQYIKYELGHTNRSFWNKAIEVYMSPFLSTLMKKQEVLERYANSLYFSNLQYGVESASQAYFGVGNMELDLAQISFLVAIPNSPTELNPYDNFDTVKIRQKLILNTLVEQGVIKVEEATAAYSEKLTIQNNFGKINAPHFVNMVMESDDLDDRVTTTLDFNLQTKVEEVVKEKMVGLEGRNATNIAVVIQDMKSGEILSLIGSRDFYDTEIDGQVNAARSLRNPGSTLKPFTYALAFEHGYSPATIINDVRQVIYDFWGKPYFPENYDKSDHGWVSIREALANSYNIPAVLALKVIGIEDFYDLMDKVGLEEIRGQNADIAATLGGCSVSLIDLVNAYRIFGNEGQYMGNPTLLLNQVANQNTPDSVINPQHSYLVTDIISDNDARRESFGSLSSLKLPFKVYAKTGTTQDFRDSWTIGFTDDYVVGVWVGNSDNSEMYGVNGVQGAGKVWNALMLVTENYYTETRKEIFRSTEIPEPFGVTIKEYCIDGFDICGKDKFADNHKLDKKSLIIQNPDIQTIEIVDPLNGDEFIIQEDTLFPIEVYQNTQFDRLLIMEDGILVSEEADGDKFINYQMKQGEHLLKVIGIRNEEESVSSTIQISVITN